MIRHSIRACTAAALLMSLTACTGAAEAPQAESTSSASASTPERGYEDWAQKAFGEEQWGAPGVIRAGGNIAPGRGGGLEFTPAKAGWYRIGLACQGPTTVELKVPDADGQFGTGSTNCGTEGNTRMKLPANKVKVTIHGADAEGQWAVAVAPAEAP